MSSPHVTDNDQALIAYLYGEGEVEERVRIERHLAECARCESEVREIQSVRTTLDSWTPPEVRLGFKVVADAPPRRRWWAVGPLPAWAQAAAAVMLFAAGAAVSQLSVRYGAEGVIIGTRWARPAGADVQASRSGPAATADARGPAGTAPSAGSAASPATSVAAAALPEQALRQGLVEAAARPEGARVSAQGQDELLRQIRAMIEQSEQRQQRELALRLAQVVRDFETQRRADLLRVDQNLGQLEGQTGAAVAQQQELLKYLVRVSEQP